MKPDPAGESPPELMDFVTTYFLYLFVAGYALIFLPFIFMMGFFELVGMPFPVVLNPAFVSWLGG